MGDRTNPIKFGPEWLRNIAPERSIGAIPGAQAGGTGAAAAPPGMGNTPATNRPATSPPTNSPKVLLARQRYGREEMLALYDRQTAEAPTQLKTNDILYEPRGQPPYALNNSFEDEARENMSRHPGPSGLSSPSDRYTGMGRGRGMCPIDKNRGIPPGDKGKTRTFNRPPPGRGWHNQRNAYSGIPDDDPNQPRLWTTNSHQPPTGLRPNNGEQPDWQPKPQYRMKRQTNTNWRQQHGRDEGEEWRSADGARRPQDKWEWGWQQEASNRPNQDKQWHNRRAWAGGEGNEDPLPEWAVDNAEACGGTFDSSGAFHGYSNDDSNIPKQQEVPYPLMKSHTHGSFSRTKTADEGMEEWWSSEKAKKLSPKRFDASNVQFKKPSKGNADEKSNKATAKTVSFDTSTSSTGAIPKRMYKAVADQPVKEKPEEGKKAQKRGNDSPEIKASIAAHKQTEENTQNKTEDVAKEKMLPSNSENVNDKGNFQSVILTSNNSLRQKHQNIVVTPSVTPKRQPKQNQYMEKSPSRQLESNASGSKNRKNTDNDKIVEDILRMNLDEGIPSATINQLLISHSNSSMDSAAQIPYPPMQMRMTNTLQGLNSQTNQNAQRSMGMPTSEGYNGMMQQPIGMTNSMLNASLGLPMPNPSTGMPQVMPPSLSNTGMSNPNALASGFQVMGGINLQQAGLQQGNMQPVGMQNNPMQGIQMQNMQGFGMQSVTALQNQLGGISNSGLQPGGSRLQSTSNLMSGMANNSLFNNQMQHSTELSGFGNTVGDSVCEAHRLQHLISSRNNTMYGPMMSQTTHMSGMDLQQRISNQWYYEDPNKTIQGPFSTKEMFNWFVAGFFSPTLMVRRECEAVMRPLGSFGPMPFGPLGGGIHSSYSMGTGYDLRPQQAHDNNMMPPNPQPGLGVDGLTSNGHPSRQPPHMGPNVQYNPRNTSQAQIQMAVKSAGPIRSRPDLQTSAPQPQPQFQLVQNNEVQALWGQPTNNAAHPDPNMWMQPNTNQQNDNPINNLPMFFWDSQTVDMPATPMVPETIKTEEEILAQMRATQAQGPTSPLSFFAESPVAAQEVETNTANAAPIVNQLQKFTQKDTASPGAGSNETEQKLPENLADAVQISSEVQTGKGNKTADKNADAKPTKDVAKVDNTKPKSKEATKQKSKKAKEEKKEENLEVKTKEEEIKVEKRSAEPSPSPKIKKEDKSNKKDLDKEKKEWIKEGFTIVKGADKSKDKDVKKKVEEAKAAEEADRKRKEEEKLAAEERKRQLETLKKQQEAGNQQAVPSRQSLESVLRKAPWSGSTQVLQSSTRDGPTLAEIQRLEREKKLEQMKQQQHMMQLIAQQQAAALAREQEMQTGLGWAKKSTTPTMNQTLGEIQAEARKQAAAMAVASAAAAPREEEVLITPPPVTTMPWANVHNGGAGFWDCPHPEPVKPVVKPAVVKAELKHKKKVTVMAPPKQENTPSVEFDMWCTNMLVSWRDTGIDVPTFVSFLRDIESPYEVKDYVKCYLGDSREAGDFARQFLEKRSRLLRVGMVTPSDDLCSPAVAVNPRTNSGSDYAELKAKGKKPKKNKMLKVDARNILGFSVTASEDRINVGDIDTV